MTFNTRLFSSTLLSSLFNLTLCHPTIYTTPSHYTHTHITPHNNHAIYTHTLSPCQPNGLWTSVWSVTDKHWALPIALKHAAWPSWTSKTPPADRVRPQHIGPRPPKPNPHSPLPPHKHLSPPSKATNPKSPTACKTNYVIMRVASIKSATSNDA